MRIGSINTEFGVQVNGKRYFPGAKCDFPGGRFIVHTQPVTGDSAEDIEVSLIIRNTGTEPLQLDEIILFHTEDPLLADVPSSDWYIYRQGRHKNDLPAIAKLSDTGAAFEDLRTTLQENGLGTDTIASRIESDTMTLLSDGGCRNLLLTYETSEDMLVETRLTLSSDHSYLGCESVCQAQIRLDPGAEITSEVLRVSFPKDPWAAIDAWTARKAARLHARKTASIPSVFCTWYYYGLTVSEEDVRENLQACLDRSLPFDVYQIDEGWERVLGDWRPNAKFPRGMTVLAKLIQDAGMVPGIWTSPFIAHETAPVTQEHPDWFLKDLAGEWVLFPMNDTVYRVMDITVPEAVAWAAQLYTDLRGMGYRYHKLDFTRAAVLYPDAVRHDPTSPMAKAYREAIDDLYKDPALYEKKKPYYKKLLSMVSHRDYSTGFYLGAPDQNSYNYTTAQYQKNANFVGKVLDVSGENPLVEQRNKFSVGETISMLLPIGEPKDVLITSITDEEGHPQESAPHAKQKVYVSLPEGACEGMILMKQIHTEE